MSSDFVMERFLAIGIQKSKTSMNSSFKSIVYVGTPKHWNKGNIKVPIVSKKAQKEVQNFAQQTVY